jgi:hypothetical protein
MSTRKLTATGLGIAALALVPGAVSASADPGNGANATTFPVSCNGQPLTFVVENVGIFGTAKVLETGSTFIATSFTLNGTPLSAKTDPTSAGQVTCTAITDGALVITGFFVPRGN